MFKHPLMESLHQCLVFWVFPKCLMDQKGEVYHEFLQLNMVIYLLQLKRFKIATSKFLLIQFFF